MTRHGRELRVTVDGEEMFSRMFGRREPENELASVSEEFRIDFERAG